MTTPNILTETYNLINQLGEPERGHCLKILAKNIDKFDEFYLASKIVTEEKQFIIYGLTDCGIVNLAKDQYLVLTDDLKLAHYLGKNNIDVINFNNIRELGWSNKKL